MILYFLKSAPEQKLKRVELAHKLGLTASGVTRMLIPLEKLHIVARDEQGDDARAHLASMTPAGEELYADALAIIRQRLEDIFPAGSKKRAGDLATLLDELAENLLQPEYRQEANKKI
jgi:DNA-binding MarR family transcriptional regulator